LRLPRRGLLKPQWFADVVVFDPQAVGDTATFAAPHQYAAGVRHVFVNGVRVLADGEHTGATPGRALRGAGANPGAVARRRTPRRVLPVSDGSPRYVTLPQELP
jgi:N-acyl-D-aspartate/D-glutamate deacylase